MASYRNRITATPVALSEYQKETNMENIEIEIPMQVLDAATFCAAKNDVRFYLNGVAIDKGHVVATDGCRAFGFYLNGVAIDKGHVVATDGCRAFACELENVGKDLPQIIIPTESVKFFLKKIPVKNRKGHCRLIFNAKTREGELRFDALIAKESFVGHDGRYPDWQRIFPRGVESEYKGYYPTFNWSYMADFQKMHKALGGNGLQVLLYPTGANSAAKVVFDSTPYPKAKGVIMPLRA
ncbi:hypothetical protein [Acinetobacter sp.]|uniref:hypothetical protein n=1 Tax=Acinetobacter sp. TaxID=472 RepID=UPI003D0117F2